MCNIFGFKVWCNGDHMEQKDYIWKQLAWRKTLV